MDKKIIKIAQLYIKTLPEKYKLKHAYIFGSYAKGMATAESDIDIALVLDINKNLFDTTVDLMKLRRKIDLRIEPHPFHAKDFQLSSWGNEIIKTGIQIA